MILDRKRILVTGVVNRRSIAYAMLPQILAGKKLDGVIDEVAKEHPTVCGTMQGFRLLDGLNRKCESISRSTVARIWKKYGPGLIAANDNVRRINAELDERRRQGRAVDFDKMGADWTRRLLRNGALPADVESPTPEDTPQITDDV